MRAQSGDASTWAIARGTVAMAFRFGLGVAAGNNTLTTMHRTIATHTTTTTTTTPIPQR